MSDCSLQTALYRSIVEAAEEQDNLEAELLQLWKQQKDKRILLQKMLLPIEQELNKMLKTTFFI